MTDGVADVPHNFPAIRPAGGDTAQPRNLRKRLRFLASQGVAPGQRLLDGGCGRGEYVVALRAAGVRAFGAEFLAEKVRAQVPGVPTGAILRADLERLPYGPASFDAILLNEVLEHVPDERAALGEAWRVLRPGGVVIILSPNRLYPFETHGVQLRRSGRPVPPYVPFVPYVPLGVGRRVFRYWARNYWVHELIRLVREAGFEPRSTSYLWQTFENISGQQPFALTLMLPVLRGVAELCERLPVIRRFGVSQAVVAVKPVAGAQTSDTTEG
jgi:ubiquinone/menaquinone biosynthesis C-methylase UbiE